MRQLAHVDLRRREYIVWSSSRSVAGMWVMNGRFRRLPAGTGPGDLGAAVQWALDGSTEGVPQPPLRGAPPPFQPVLDDLGLPTYAKYMTGTRSTTVERDNDSVVITPYHNGGARGGFVPLPDAATRLDQPDADALGTAVAEALTRST
ncbi:MAG TPA: hypothetical protein VJT31_15000 [Rugosimonospora sp.]|nr:hypothetical protein [Rugosimonospora sp.]